MLLLPIDVQIVSSRDSDAVQRTSHVGRVVRERLYRFKPEPPQENAGIFVWRREGAHELRCCFRGKGA
jgi:hypothetical protein